MTKLVGLSAGVLALTLALTPDASAQTLTANLNGGEETPILDTGAVGTAEVSVDAVNQEIHGHAARLQHSDAYERRPYSCGPSGHRRSGCRELP